MPWITLELLDFIFRSFSEEPDIRNVILHYTIMMQAAIIENRDVSYLDAILLKDDLPIPVHYDDIKAIPHEDIRLWCLKNAVYQVPTIELIEWIREKIDGRFAIEIGSGKNGIGKALGILSTDSWLQTDVAIQTLYAAVGQPTVVPPDYVEKIDAIEAVNKYRPQVVLGCFITHKWEEGDTEGNMFGVAEEEIIKQATYINVGNRITHRGKHILKVPHQEFQFPWLVSRSMDQSQNVIWEWK